LPAQWAPAPAHRVRRARPVVEQLLRHDRLGRHHRGARPGRPGPGPGVCVAAGWPRIQPDGKDRLMAAWNYVQTGPAQAGAPGGLQPEGPGEQDYVEFLPFQEASGNGPFRVDQAGNVTANGVSAHKGGTDTSATATASSPSFSSGTAAQVNTTQ